MTDMPTDERRGDRHKRAAVPIRLPEDLALWLEAYCEATGRARHAVLVEAVREYQERHQAD